MTSPMLWCPVVWCWSNTHRPYCRRTHKTLACWTRWYEPNIDMSAVIYRYCCPVLFFQEEMLNIFVLSIQSCWAVSVTVDMCTYIHTYMYICRMSECCLNYEIMKILALTFVRAYFTYLMQIHSHAFASLLASLTYCCKGSTKWRQQCTVNATQHNKDVAFNCSIHEICRSLQTFTCLLKVLKGWLNYGNEVV